MRNRMLMAVVLCLPAGAMAQDADREEREPYRIVDSGQVRCYDARTETTYPKAGAAFFGQDAQYQGHEPAYVDNGDGTVTDRNTGLTWQADPGAKRSFAEAKAGAAKCRTGGHDDWRLPSIVDYSRSPDTTDSAAIDPVFKSTAITNEGGRKDYAHYWTSTTHVGTRRASAAVYIAFGRALGFMGAPGPRGGDKLLMDVHGAGAQRSDDKSGDPGSFPEGRGPQGDVVRIENLVRCVRGGRAEARTSGPEVAMRAAPAGSEAPADRPEGPGGRPPSGADFVRRLDRNGDGKVSRSEFDGPASHFDDFDRNGDGFISADEAPKGPPPRPR